MVQRIRIRGHVLQLHGAAPSTSRKPPEYCRTCGRFFNDGDHRKCVFLCCGYIHCYSCVRKSKYFCSKVRRKKRLSQSEIMNLLFSNDKNFTIDSGQAHLSSPSETNMDIVPNPNKLRCNKSSDTSTEIAKVFNPTLDMPNNPTWKSIVPKRHWKPVVYLERLTMKKIKATIAKVNDAKLNKEQINQAKPSFGNDKTRGRGRTRA